MAYTPSQIIGWAKIAEPLSLIGEAKKKVGDKDLSAKIYQVRKTVEWFYDQLNLPGYTASVSETAYLQNIADYLYALIGPYQSAVIAYDSGIAPSITVQPVSQSVSVGADVVFIIGATGTATLTYQWYKNGVAMSGKTSSTLTLSSVSSGDAANYTCVVTNSYGTATSNAAVLSVGSTAYTAYWIGLTSDPFSTINGGSDPYTYTNSVAFTHGGDITFPLADGDNNKYFIFKVPAGEPTKTAWALSLIDTGSIPGFAMRAKITIGAFDYYLSVSQLSYASGSSMILS